MSAIRFNPFTAEFRADPYAVYRQLRETAPVLKSGGMWVMTRHADVSAVLADTRFSVSQIPDALGKLAADYPAFERFARKSIVFTDRPEHTRLRSLVNRAFLAKVVQARRPHIQKKTDELVARMQGEIDFISQVADPLPLHVMAEMMGLPEEIRPQVSQWTHAVRFLLEPTLVRKSEFAAIDRQLSDCMAYMRAHVARALAAGNEFIGALAGARTGDESLTEEEIVFSCIMTFVAGHETTTCLLGNGMLALLQHPEQLELVRQQPELTSALVTEMMRFDCPLQQTLRRAREDVVLGASTVRAGENVLLCLGAANRDPERYPDPERFDVKRDATGHLAFGRGMHGCLGAALAGIEAEILFGTLLARSRSITLKPDGFAWLDHSHILRGPKALHIEVELNA